jgi:decaprenylphospho-beta-D-erythro-pentofuranosid-2-ulose 2-reductase
MQPFQQALIIGASSGIGAALATELARNGTKVALVARSKEKLDALCARINQDGTPRAFSYIHDVCNVDEVPELFKYIEENFGNIDLVVYASGVTPPIQPDEYSTDKDKRIIEVNLTGAMAWLNEAASRFQKKHQGTIVGISSVAGDRGRRLAPAYGAAKAGLAVYLESLRNRLAPYNISVVTIKPGYVATPMTAGMKLPRFLPVISADRAAQLIIDAIEQGRQIAYVPAIWRSIMWIIRAIPSSVFRRLNI